MEESGASREPNRGLIPARRDRAAGASSLLADLGDGGDFQRDHGLFLINVTVVYQLWETAPRYLSLSLVPEAVFMRHSPHVIFSIQPGAGKINKSC
jgi:hypothetical protein